MLDPLRNYREHLKRFKRVHLIIIFLVVPLVIIASMNFLVLTTKAVDFSWVQTDWSGGIDTNVVTSNNNTFLSQSSVNFTTSGELSLGATSNWWDPSWSYRKVVNLSNSGSVLTDYQVMINLNTAQLIDDSKLQADCDDLRIVSSTGVAFDFAIDPDSACDTTTTEYWAQVSSIPVGTSTIYIYYGNSSATNVLNPDGTFEFFDEFAGSGLDGNKWQSNVVGTLPTTISSGYLKPGYPTYSYNGSFIADGTSGAQHQAKYGGVDNIAVEWKSYLNMNTSLDWGQSGFALVDSSNNARVMAYQGDWTVNSYAPVSGYFTGSSGTQAGMNNPDTLRFRITRNGTNTSVYKDGALFGSGTLTQSPAKLAFIISAHTPFGYYLQDNRIYWVFTRKLALTIPTISTYGSEETQTAQSGTVESNIFDTGFASNWNNIEFTKSGGGTIIVKVRTGDASDLSDAIAFVSCSAVTTTSDISANDCVDDSDRYIQYEVTLATSASTPVFELLTISYTPQDSTPPSANATSIQVSGYTNGDWINSDPTLTWTAGTDAQVGIAGYCVSLDEVDVSAGSSSTLNPVTSSGLFTGIDDSQLLSPTICPYIVTGTSLNLASISDLNLTSGKKYYFSIKALDRAGNIWTGSTNLYQDLAWFRFDNTPPTSPSFISMPSNFISTKDVTITWPTSSGAAADSNSGLAGLQYRIGVNGIWYGDIKNGNQNLTDLLLNNGTYTTDETVDYPLLVEGVNVIYLRAMDNAGNASTQLTSGALKLNTIAPGQVQNLTATPDDNTVNEYSFDWDAPSSFSGLLANLTYCYTINTVPNVNNCNYTAAGITQIVEDAYATQPGENIFYVVVKDEAGNINYATRESVVFTYSGTAPSIPLNIGISDISVKETQDWKLAVTWSAPANIGAGVDKYKVYRAIGENLSCSSDMSTFSEISTVLDTSYISTGLTQQNYSYCVRACDSANNCSAISSTVSDYPTGKYTTPAILVSGPNTGQITTRKAVISWSTQRNSDSKIQYGKTSGTYLDEEFSKSSQVTEHVITLNNLEPGTTYFYRSKWTDEDGNTGISEEKSFKTEPAPEILNVQISTVGINFALIKFTSNRSQKVNIYYGKTNQFGGLQTINTSSAETQSIIQLTGLDDGTKYSFKINPFDLDGFEYEGTVLDFTTIPRPRISSVNIEEVKGTAQPTVEISWESNTDISSIVTYYPIDNPGLKRDAVDVDLLKTHKIKISTLNAETKYTLVVRGIDKLGNEAITNEYLFTTATDSRPPVISNLNVETVITNSTEEDNAQIIISWSTDEFATSQVIFGKGISSDLSQSTTEDKNLKFNHVIVISNLSPSEVYTVRAVSRDSQRNETQSADNVAVTPTRTDSALEVILQNVSDIFGIN